MTSITTQDTLTTVDPLTANATANMRAAQQALWQACLAFEPSAIHHAQTLNALQGQWAERCMRNGTASAALWPEVSNRETWNELFALQSAVMARLQQQQAAWLQGLSGLAEEVGQLRRVNTMSKLAEQQSNLIAQFGQLVSGQMVNFMSLQENVQIDYGYWLSQKLTPAATP